jgi:hypothetical protein
MSAATVASWMKLEARLNEAGIKCHVTARSGTGRTAHFIAIRHGDSTVEVHDQWWRKNEQVWIGWDVYEQNDRTGITGRTFPLTKKYSEVVSRVTELLGIEVAA